MFGRRGFIAKVGSFFGVGITGRSVARAESSAVFNQDVLDLRRKFEAAVQLIAGRSPSGQVIALYPCGCSSLGNFDADQMPRYCSEDGDPEHTDRCHVIHGIQNNVIWG